MIPKETGNNVYAKFWVDKQRVLWYFLYWLMEGLDRFLRIIRRFSLPCGFKCENLDMYIKILMFMRVS